MRHRWERDDEYQETRGHFGHTCPDTLPLPRKEGMIRRTTQHLLGLIAWGLITCYQLITLVYVVAPRRGWVKVQRQVTQANH